MNSLRSASRTAVSRFAVNTVASAVLAVQTKGVGFVDLTGEVAAFLEEADAGEGIGQRFVGDGILHARIIRRSSAGADFYQEGFWYCVT